MRQLALESLFAMGDGELMAVVMAVVVGCGHGRKKPGGECCTRLVQLARSSCCQSWVKFLGMRTQQ